MSIDVDTKIAASICKEFRVLVEQRVNIALDDRMAPKYIMALRLADVHAVGPRAVEASIPSNVYAHVAGELLDLASVPTYAESGDGYVTRVGKHHYRFTW